MKVLFTLLVLVAIPEQPGITAFRLPPLWDYPDPFSIGKKEVALQTKITTQEPDELRNEKTTFLLPELILYFKGK